MNSMKYGNPQIKLRVTASFRLRAGVTGFGQRTGARSDRVASSTTVPRFRHSCIQHCRYAYQSFRDFQLESYGKCVVAATGQESFNGSAVVGVFFGDSLPTFGYQSLHLLSSSLSGSQFYFVTGEIG